MKKFIGVLLMAGLLAGNVYSYGPRGHALVGAIADQRLKGKPVATKISQLLDGLTLAQAATLPDSIKSWDPCGKKKAGTSPVTSKKRINAELHAFVNANPCDGNPSHHEFHFTDVPVFGNEKYLPGKVGRSDFDIVHMIPFCIRVLTGAEPANNKRKITKSVAIILLAHYMGDIHQPLHVGAEYFNGHGKPFEPTVAKPGFSDQGGNKLTLTIFGPNSKTIKFPKLHSYWDGNAVTTAFGETPDAQSAKDLANDEPANWRPSAGIENWAEIFANEILPVAREAHDRLEFKNIKFTSKSTEILSGDATEKPVSSGMSYQDWAGATVKDEIHKAGWRLAALLEEALQ
jgi:hypothetical protein